MRSDERPDSAWLHDKLYHSITISEGVDRCGCGLRFIGARLLAELPHPVCLFLYRRLTFVFKINNTNECFSHGPFALF